jgi:hypothetical protein
MTDQNLAALTQVSIWGILNDTVDDETVNQWVWDALGYRFNPETQQWDCSTVEASWAEAYPEPPNFIESRPATVKLTRSIPAEHKQLLKEQLGFAGYKVGELVPRKTRRATMANWLLSYLAQKQA